MKQTREEKKILRGKFSREDKKKHPPPQKKTMNVSVCNVYYPQFLTFHMTIKIMQIIIHYIVNEY